MKRKIFAAVLIVMAQLLTLNAAAFETNTGELSNLVVFVRFADETADEVFTKEFSTYETLFNSEDDDANSVYNYFKKASYGQLDWKSTFFPTPNGTKIVSYQAKYERGYYEEKSSINATGYDADDATESAARLQALVKEIATYLDNNLTDGDAIDKNSDSMVDNLTIIFSGGSALGSSHLLWPKRTDLALPDEMAIYVKGKKLVGYLMVFDEANGYSSVSSGFNPIDLNNGVLCHEMSHSLGTYDLYHASGSLNPVGVWDLMSDNQQTAQNMTAYTKMKYCKWISEIPEISEAGTYTLNPIGSSSAENIAYKIKPNGSDEYFVVEYRPKSGFDSNLPDAGLIVYRINPAYSGGNVNYNGTTRLDEQYIFRPGGTTTADGDISKAAFSAENGRTEFGGTADYKPFYSDGTEAKFALQNISSAGATISFDLVAMEKQIIVGDATVKIGGAANSGASTTVSSDVAWTMSGLPDWLSASPVSGEAGKTTVNFTALSENTELKNREAELTLAGSDGENEITATITVVQTSNVVAAPQNLKAQEADGKVTLSWDAVVSGTLVLSDNFENTENPLGWTFENSDNRGWTYKSGTVGKGFYRPYEGSYAMTMVEAWDEVVEDQKLISPTFANGKTLVFQSRSNGVKATPKVPQYYCVEVSNDGGSTWTSLYNANTDGTTSGKYEKVTLDLSQYLSENMKVRFHAYSDYEGGLSYYWQIDNLEIYPAESDVNVTGYNIYRNGKLIASSQTTSYTDESPADGTNVYTVSAIGNFGEGPLSDEVTLTITAINAIENGGDAVEAVYSLDGMKVSSSDKSARCGVYIIKGVKGARKVLVR